MTISNDLYLDGFQKINCGEDGMVFVRYSKPEADERAAEIESNAGMAVRMLEDLIGKENVRRQDDELSYDELKELAWEDRGAFDD